MKRRIISLLAVVAMLVSMLTCVIIPASADDSITAPYAALLEDVPGATSLAAVIDGATDANVLANALQEDVTAGRITWPVWAYGSENYPCYEYHAVYEAAGYDGKNWSISDPADWDAMNTTASAKANENPDPRYIDDAGNYFKGVTFHLTKDIVFDDTARLPLGAHDFRYFAGTIDGHGFGFSDIVITVKSANVYDTKAKTNAHWYYNDGAGSMDGSIGLIGFLGNCVIRDFGINSGTINAGTGNGSGSGSTFGTVIQDMVPTFERVWSGADINGVQNSHVNGLIGTKGSKACSVKVNGFVFNGSLYKSKLHSTTARNTAYGVYGGAGVAPADGDEFYNIITYPTIKNAATDVASFIFGFTTKEAFEKAIVTDKKIQNVYGLKKDKGLVNTYRVGTSGQNAGATTFGGTDYNLIKDMSDVEAAWTINNNPTATNPVYFVEKAEGKIRPVAADANGMAPDGAIAKVIYKIGDETVAEELTQKGAALTKAEMLEKIGLTEAEIKSITVNGSELTEASIVVGITTTVAADPSPLGQLGEIAKKYENLEKKYLTDESVAALDKFVADAKAITDDAAATEFMKTEADLIASLDTYHNYPMAEGKEIPAYSLKETYGAFNKTQNWVIKTKEDWAAMRDVADVATGDYFKGVTFHLVDDVDFEMNKSIAPMGGNMDDATAAFAGTIEGHGFGFNDIYILSAKNPAFGTAGLFLRLSDCIIKDFGLNSGMIRQTSSSGSGCTSSFGSVLDGKVPTFERVWSSAIITASCNAQLSGLVGTFGHKNASVNLNGFVFDGALIKSGSDNHAGQLSYGIYGSFSSAMADGDNFYNIITDFAAYNGSAVPNNEGGYTITKSTNHYATSALFTFTSTKTFEASTIENVYAVKRESDGIDEGYFHGAKSFAGGRYSDTLLTDMSAPEAAWTINSNPSQAADAVYFTLKDGKVRPVADPAHRIVKLTLTGGSDKEIYVNCGIAYNLSDLGISSQGTLEVKEGSCDITATQITLNSDATVETNSTCAHVFDYVVGENEHTKSCATCGYKEVEACSAGSYTQSAATLDELVDGKIATHSGTCQFCNAAFTHKCTVEYKVQAKANVWDYSCVCGRDDVVHEGASLMVSGDASNDGNLNLIDALRLLEKLASMEVTMNAHNADANGDNSINMLDVSLVIRAWLGDSKALDTCETVQNRVNVGNYYDLNSATFQNLKMDGTMGENDRYVVTDFINVSKDNKLVFGPVRLAQPVMGYFYDADEQPLELINHTNIDVEYTFEEGMIMASILIPEGVAKVKLQVNAKEKNSFYARINNAFTVADYQIQANADADALENPEKNQYFLTIGDSLCSAARDDTPYAGRAGWEGRIYRDFGSVMMDSSEGGSALSTVSLSGDIDEDLLTGETATSRQWIVSQLREYNNTHEFEYILLEGGANDAAYDAPIGTVSDSFDPTTFDISTCAGGMELLIYTAIKEHGDTAAIGYMTVYPMPLASRFTDSGEYLSVCKQICEKWGIPYLDLYTDMADFDTSKYTSNGKGGVDYIHANGEGYDMIQEHLRPFVPKMRPISKEIYLKVQQYAQTQE